MRPPARIRDWLEINKMFQWLQSAADEASYKRRMAIWLTHTGKLHANKVAEILGVSEQSVWLWVRQYNNRGPAGLERKGRGGRRWGFMSVEEETELLRPLIRKARSGNPPKPSTVKDIIEEKLKRKVSMSYVYHLLKRQGWADILAQSHLMAKPSDLPDTFEKLSRPWLRYS